MATFPNGKLTASGFKRNVSANVLRSEMESGVPKQVLINSKKIRRFPVTYLFTDVEYTLFETWVKQTITFIGVFDWTDPFTGQLLQAHIVNGDISDARPMNPQMDRWLVTMEFEVL